MHVIINAIFRGGVRCNKLWLCLVLGMVVFAFSCKQTNTGGGNGKPPEEPSVEQEHPAEIEYKVGNISFKLKRIDAVKDGLIGSDDKYSTGSFAYPSNREHTVNLSEYYIGETEVTQELYDAVMGESNSSEEKAKLPVTNVLSHFACRFCDKLTSLILKDEDAVYSGGVWNPDFSKKGFRLPTDAEWEWAAQGGKARNKWSGTSDKNELQNYAHVFDPNSSGERKMVAQKKPNEFGLYDMTGNVSEYVQSSFYRTTESGKTNPALTDDEYSLRGGSYASHVDIIPCAEKRSGTGLGVNYGAGIRIVRRLENVPQNTVTVILYDQSGSGRIDVYEVAKGSTWAQIKKDAIEKANSYRNTYEPTDECYRVAPKGEDGAILLTDDFVFEKKTKIFPVFRVRDVTVTVCLTEGETQLTLAQPNTFKAKAKDEWKDIKAIAEEKITINDPNNYSYSWKKKDKNTGKLVNIDRDAYIGVDFVAYAVSCPVADNFIIEPPLSDTSATKHVLKGYKAEPTGELTIPEGVTEIEYGLFRDCTRITSLKLPTTLREIWGIFNNCSGLQGELDLSMCTQVKEVIKSFTDCIGITSIKLPSQVKELGGFSGCTGLVGELDLSAYTEVEKIFGFSRCTGITSIKLPSQIKILYGFDGCPGLVGELDLSAYTALENISGFNRCTGITSIKLPSLIKKFSLKDCNGLAGELDLSSCTQLTELTINKCKNIKSFKLPISLSVVNFRECSSLETLDISNYTNITSLGLECFRYCTKLSSIKLPENLSVILPDCFIRCENLRLIEINSVRDGTENKPKLKSIYDDGFTRFPSGARFVIKVRESDPTLKQTMSEFIKQLLIKAKVKEEQISIE